jgi:hypothetical protein
MSRFLKDEKPEQATFKANAPYFSDGARTEGYYKNHPYPFCLPRDHATENLFPGIRQPILDYFSRNKIKWHDGQHGNPSNHMCDSQVCCANFLFPFYDQPAALAALLRPIYPFIECMLPIEDGQYVAFEWIGQRNYLGEKISRNGQRTRGANFTSADAAVLFKRNDGRRQIALIEWKYTESYYPTWLRYARSGTDRTTIYQHLFFADDCPLAKELIPSFDSLFYEPFYQFMRQQFLAHEMEKAEELGASVVSLLHLSPAHNRDFTRTTSPDLAGLDTSATGVWNHLVKNPDRFQAEYVENVFGDVPIQAYPQLIEWWHYIVTRYRWVRN